MQSGVNLGDEKGTDWGEGFGGNLGEGAEFGGVENQPAGDEEDVPGNNNNG